MFPISIWWIVLAEFVSYVFTYLGIHFSIDDENAVFRNAKNKAG